MPVVEDNFRVAGRVEYLRRAYEQDAQEAMRGDIIRGLIELITNADDAYARAGADRGKIRVEVEHRRGSSWRVVVRDRATGMSQAEMIKKLASAGGRTSGFETGEAIRGNLGRGAKDLPSFGEVEWESIKGQEYAALKLLPSGEYAIPRVRRTATAEDRKQLGIPRGNGTVVTVMVRDSVRCPNHATLRQRLSTHFQLRDIMSDPEREVVAVNLNNPSDANRLTFALSGTELLRTSRLNIPGVETLLELRRLPEPSLESATDPYRLTGIIIKGSRAIYENTLFSFEGNPHAARLHGRLVCDHIDALAREYDDRVEAGLPPTPDNPMPIISRTRETLRREHPFYAALKQAAEEVLIEVVKEEEEKARREALKVENDAVRRDLDRLAREVAQFMDDELRESDEPIPKGPLDGALPRLAIIPSEAVCYMGETKTLSVVALREGLAEGDEVSVSVDPPGVVELADGFLVPLRIHKRQENLLIGRIRLRPLVPNVTLVQAEVDQRFAEAIVTVKEQKTQPLPTVPTTLEFVHRHYSLQWQRTRALVLRAPRGLCPKGSPLTVSSSSPGVVVLDNEVSMTFNPTLDYDVGQVRVEARTLGAEGTIRASVGRLSAHCRVTVTREGEGPNLRFEIANRESRQWRALWEDRKDEETGKVTRVLVIQGRHPALHKYLGDPSAFPGQNDPWTRLLIAEIVADNVCREIATRLEPSRSEDERPDSYSFYSEHYERMSKLLPRLQRLMLPVLPR